LLLAIYLLGTTELHQLVKIPGMVAHYQQFEKDNPGFGFVTFLRVHYMYPLNTSDQDYEQDRQLPFKSVDNCGITINLIVPQPYYFTAPQKMYALGRVYPIHKGNFYAYQLPVSIFQPPKA